MKKIYWLGFWVCPLLTFGQITGRVWQDNNANGLSEKLERGSTLVRVRAFSVSGKLLAESTSTQEGKYFLAVEAGERVRVEFSNLGTDWKPSRGQTQIHFITSPGELNLGLFRPSQFVGSTAKAAQAIYVNGNYNDVGADSLAALVCFEAGSSATGAVRRLASPRQVGAIWGLSYDRHGKRLFAASLAKRHSGFGPLGSGGIYVIPDLSAETLTQKSNLQSVESQTVQSFISLDSLGFATRPASLARDLSGALSSVSHDSLMFGLVGKMGLGGMALSEDGGALFVMNLFDRKLYRLALPADGTAPRKADVQAYSLPSLRNSTGEARPFAVQYHEGKVYVGLVWDATKSGKASDLKASVLMMDPNEGNGQFAEIFSTALNYSRGVLDYGVSGWRPWIDDYNQAVVPNAPNWLIYPQPMLADIEFDTDGSMILGFMDRLGHQTGDGQQFRPTGSPQVLLYRGLSGGDVLRVARSRQRFELEQNARLSAEGLPTVWSAGQDNGQGPGGGEFYVDDNFSANGITWHHETAMGGLALLPESNELLVASREPVAGQYLTGGVKWFSNQTGLATGARSLFPAGAAPGYFWKTNNVGGITLIPDKVPMQLGDRVWHDLNSNGLQDADEPGFAAIEVDLYLAGKRVAMTQTDEQGYYRFGDADVVGGLLAGTAYEIRIALQQPNDRIYQLPLRSKTALETDMPTEIDNDASEMNGVAVIRLTTSTERQSLRGLDVGFKMAGDSEASDPTGRLTLSPNPASSQTQLVYWSKQADGPVGVLVRDTSGKLVQTHAGSTHNGQYHQQINLSNLPVGQYIISITDGPIQITRSLLKYQ